MPPKNCVAVELMGLSECMDTFSQACNIFAEQIFVYRSSSRPWCVKESSRPPSRNPLVRSDCTISAISMHILIEVGVGNFRRRPFVVVMSN